MFNLSLEANPKKKVLEHFFLNGLTKRSGTLSFHAGRLYAPYLFAPFLLADRSYIVVTKALTKQFFSQTKACANQSKNLRMRKNTSSGDLQLEREGKAALKAGKTRFP